jgi:hypothetical protein
MRTRRREEKGIALVAVLIVMVLLMAIGGALHTGVISETILRGAHARATAGFYAAEAGINRGIGEYRNIFLSWSVPAGADFDEKTFALGDRTVKYQMTQVGAPNQTVLVPAGRPFAGLNAIRNVYVADATSELNTGDVEANLGTEFDVDVISLFQFLAFYTGDLEILPGPIMQLNGPIHTNGSLYLNSGNTMTIAETAAVPTVSVSAAGNVVRGRKDAPATCGGTVSIASLQDVNGDGNLDRINMPCAGNQSDAQLSVWLGSIRARQPVLAVPNPSILARGAGQYWTGADLRIVLNLDRPDALGRFPIEAQMANGAVDPVANASLQAFMNFAPGAIFYNDRPRPGEDQDLPCGDGNSYCRFDNYTPSLPDADHVYPCSRSLLGLYPAADCPFTVVNEVHTTTGTLTARKGGFYNNREQRWVYMLNVNMRDLLWWNRNSAFAGQMFDPDDNSDFGVVVFLSVQGPGSTGAIPSPRYGVRVFGSPNLDFPAMVDPTGLSVVSDQGVYVEGDYNVGDGGRPWMPASLMGDTINVLSNNWWRGYPLDPPNYPNCKGDCQSRRPLANRTAGHATLGWAGFANRTDVLAAFIGGVDVTAVGNYNGGFENYPRFHERWGGITLFYRGSFVSLGQPQRSNGPWCGTGAGCNIYDPPGTRNWNFDARFQQAENLPPMTPQVLSVNQILFTENFR